MPSLYVTSYLLSRCKTKNKIANAFYCLPTLCLQNASYTHTNLYAIQNANLVGASVSCYNKIISTPSFPSNNASRSSCVEKTSYSPLLYPTIDAVRYECQVLNIKTWHEGAWTIKTDRAALLRRQSAPSPELWLRLPSRRGLAP